MKKNLAIALFVIGILLLGLGPVQAEWTPSEDIMFFISGTPGSGSDMVARAMIKAVNDNKLLPRPLQAENLAGGQGGKARASLIRKKGNPHYLMTYMPSHLIAMLRTGDQIKNEDFTPLVNFAVDVNVFAVQSDSPYKSFKEVIEAIKSKPGTFTVATSLPGAIDSITTYLIQDAVGAKIKQVPMQASAKAVIALLGGHVDATICNPGEIMPQVEAGKARVLAIMGEVRHPDFPGVPSAKELGIDVAIYSFRGIVMAPDVPDEAVAHLEGVFKKAYETDTFQKFLKDQGLTPYFLGRKEFKTFLEKNNNDFKKVLTENGLIEKK